MRLKPFIWAYNQNSEGAIALGQALGALRIKRGPESKFRPGTNKLIINWGDSKGEGWPDPDGLCTLLNKPDRVHAAANKLEFFRALPEDRVVPWTAEAEVAMGWLRDGKKVVCRTKLNGHSGEGIVIHDNILLDIPAAPLYTRYIPKKSEWRVHVVNGKVIDVQRKIRNPDVADDQINWQVRSHGNGFIFARESGKPEDQRILDWAVDAVGSLGLDFGAVDVLWGGRNPYLLEVNSAPGLTGTTLTNYVNAFKQEYGL